MQFFCYAVAHPGLEHITAGELGELGITPGRMEPGGVEFATDLVGLYAANLRLRTASRVLVRIATFHAHSFPELERHARRLPWREYVAAGAPVSFRVTSRKSKLYHQRAVAERLARAAEAPVGETGTLFVVRLLRDECTVSVDSSGELLHRRGYRLANAKAPLRETLAAGILLAAGWDGRVPLIDPMCGSGTIPIEAALIARRIPPGLRRSFAFQQWSGFEPALWERLRRDAASDAARPAAPILASDRDAGAVAAALENAARAGVADSITIRRTALSGIETPGVRGLIVTNPPYGTRVGERRALRDLYAQLGNVSRRSFEGWRLVMLSAHPELAAQVGLAFETLARTNTGGIDVSIVAADVSGPVRPGPAHRSRPPGSGRAREGRSS